MSPPLAQEDILTPIHKALRSMIYGLSARLQTHDFSDLEATKALAVDMENDFAIARSAGCILCVLNRHAADEEAEVFPHAVEAGNTLVPSLIEDHHEFARREVALAKAMHDLLAMHQPGERIQAGVELNQSANELFGAYILHMNREETQLLPWMRERFTDAQLGAMSNAIVGRQPPERLFAILNWMVPSLNTVELTGFLRRAKAGMPPPALKAVADVCTQRVDPARWAAVRQAVGL